MTSLIDSTQEFYEVLNEFPILKDRLKDLKVNVADLKEGLTIEEYFVSKSYSKDEIAILIRKFNLEVKQLLKNGDSPKMDYEVLEDAILEEE